MSKIKRLKPKYSSIKVNGKKVTRKEDHNKCDQIQDKSRNQNFLLQKAESQSTIISYIYIKCAHYCNGMWQHIQNSVYALIILWTLYT